ncbi:DUF3052 family protein [soil metagenome]
MPASSASKPPLATNPARAAGYSTRSLIEKLGIKAEQRMAVLHAPANYARLLGPLPEQVVRSETLGEPLDFVHCFSTSRQELAELFPRLKAALADRGICWIAWPKRTSKAATIKISTDLDENGVREIGLANGLVDVKVAAIDEIWSGLKFVYRLKDRGK